MEREINIRGEPISDGLGIGVPVEPEKVFHGAGREVNRAIGDFDGFIREVAEEEEEIWRGRWRRREMTVELMAEIREKRIGRNEEIPEFADRSKFVKGFNGETCPNLEKGVWR